MTKRKGLSACCCCRIRTFSHCCAIHKPNGSPANLKYHGVEPTGKLPKSVDFGLLSGNSDKKFAALIFGDPQPYTLEEIEHFKKGIVSEVENIQGIAFGAALGDLVGDRPNGDLRP